MTNAGVSLDVRNLRKSWGETDVLLGIDFQIAPGGFLTLLGPSGCGKSTALRLISGLDEVSGGNILIDGKEVSRLPADQRNIGMVFQNYALFPHMTVEENIAYGLRVRKVAKPTRKASVNRVAELMALGPLLDRKPAQLSGGQQQRVAVARAMVTEPDIILADEPTANLDSSTGAALLDMMRELNERKNMTFLFSTHDTMIMERAKRLVMLKDGQVARDETRE